MLKNNSEEQLDYIVEGREDATTTVVFVHGFGTDKNETADLFKDISASLNPNFRTIRFDFSGYGESEGKQEDVCLSKQSQDLESVLEFVKELFPGNIYILAHSLGGFVTSALSPNGIKKIIFTGIPRPSTTSLINSFQKRILSRNGKVDLNNISIYPRSSGQTQKLGPIFWKELQSFNIEKNIQDYALKTNLLILKPKQDEVASNENFDAYKHLENLIYQELNGDHNFTKQADRSILIERVREHFME